MRSRFIRTIQIGLATAIALFGLGVVASPAQASIPSTCTTGHEICVYTSTNFTGSMKHFQLSSGCMSFVYPYDDNISSVAVGDLSHHYTLWSNTNCTGVQDPWYDAGTRQGHMSNSIVGDNEAGSVSFNSP